MWTHSCPLKVLCWNSLNSPLKSLIYRKSIVVPLLLLPEKKNPPAPETSGLPGVGTLVIYPFICVVFWLLAVGAVEKHLGTCSEVT